MGDLCKRIGTAAVLLATSWWLSGWCLQGFSDLSMGVRQLARRNAPQGFTVTYYSGRDFQEEICRRIEPHLRRFYGTRAPAWGVPRNDFSARWEGWLICPSTTNYVFYSQSNDGFRLIIDDEPVLDNWRPQRWTQSGTHGSAWLTQGVHHVVAEFFAANGEAALRVKWAGGGIGKNTVMGGRHVFRQAPYRKEESR